MDKFKNVITINKLILKRMHPLPNKPSYSYLEISYDKFNEFINWYILNDIKLPLLEVAIYDESSILSYNDINLRRHLIEVLNNQSIISISFHLSDTTLPLYNKIMSEHKWKHKNETNIFMSINRHPKERRELSLPLTQGKLILQEEDLIWLPLPILHQLSNIVDEQTLQKAIKLKEIARKFYLRLCEQYHVDKLSEFDKIWLVYNYLNHNISFANEATRYVDGKQVLYNPNSIYDWVKEPLGTYIHKRGVCNGQSRLAQALLNNPYLRSDTKVINGKCPLGEHVWIGSVINDRLYQTCLTMTGPFKDLERKGYIPNDTEIYPKIYETATLSNEDLFIIQSHIKRLKR